MGVQKTQYIHVNFNGHIVICDINKSTTCDDVIKMAAVRSAQSDENAGLFIKLDSDEKRIARNAKMVKLIRSLGLDYGRYSFIIKHVEKQDSKSKFAETACKALRKLLLIKSFLARKPAESEKTKPNTTLNTNLNMTTGKSNYVVNKNMNDLLLVKHRTTKGIHHIKTNKLLELSVEVSNSHRNNTVSDTETESLLVGLQSRSILNNGFFGDPGTETNLAFVDSFVDSLVVYDETVRDLFNQCIYISDNDQTESSEAYSDREHDDDFGGFAAAATVGIDADVSMGDDSDDESIDELEMNIESDITELGSDTHSTLLFLREASASSLFNCVNSLNLGYHEHFMLSESQS